MQGVRANNSRLCGKSRYVLHTISDRRTGLRNTSLLRATLSRRRRCRYGQTQKSYAGQQLIQATSPRVTRTLRYTIGARNRHPDVGASVQHRTPRGTDDMSTRHQQMIMKLLISAAIALVRWLGARCRQPPTRTRAEPTQTPSAASTVAVKRNIQPAARSRGKRSIGESGMVSLPGRPGAISDQPNQPRQ